MILRQVLRPVHKIFLKRRYDPSADDTHRKAAILARVQISLRIGALCHRLLFRIA